jgi:biopolymer transport protein ExbD
MTDLVFLLLVFFIILSTEFNPTNSIPVNLPQGGSNPPKQTEMASITVKDDNTIFLNGKETTLDGLEDLLLANIKDDKEKPIVLYSDEKAEFGIAAKILDIVKQNQLKIAISMKK